MAKTKSGVNKSEKIRDALTEMPNSKAREIVAHLKAKGIEVSEHLVYNVKKTSKMKKKPGRKPGTQVKTMVAAAPSSNGKLGVGASITLVKTTAEKVGGWAALKEIVEALA